MIPKASVRKQNLTVNGKPWKSLEFLRFPWWTEIIDSLHLDISHHGIWAWEDLGIPDDALDLETPDHGFLIWVSDYGSP